MDHAEKVKGQFKAQYKDKHAHKKSSQSKPWKRDNKERTYSKKEVQMLLKRCNERQTSKRSKLNAMEDDTIEQAIYDVDNMNLSNSEALDNELDKIFGWPANSCLKRQKIDGDLVKTSRLINKICRAISSMALLYE